MRAMSKGSAVTWTKTDAGRAEIQSRGLIKERARRNLLLLVDGARSESALLGQVAGVTHDDFEALEELGLIVSADRGARRAVPDMEPTVPMPLGVPAEVSAEVPKAGRAGAEPDNYIAFTATLNQLISKQLGLRGFTLVLAVEKASTPHELIAVAQRVIEAIRERKGEEAAEAARAALFGAEI
jgi:hypothetical protein